MNSSASLQAYMRYVFGSRHIALYVCSALSTESYAAQAVRPCEHVFCGIQPATTILAQCPDLYNILPPKLLLTLPEVVVWNAQVLMAAQNSKPQCPQVQLSFSVWQNRHSCAAAKQDPCCL
eukprot:GHRR01025758.1.p1 GENE.GHRR01025758.1~~GHRR01025758.1.p1  ORF type:complete len:121 (-),score=7.72 GHRR01025758.1:465-827(-)